MAWHGRLLLGKTLLSPDTWLSFSRASGLTRIVVQIRALSSFGPKEDHKDACPIKWPPD